MGRSEPGKHRFAITNRRIRGGKNELIMVNGRIGQQQGGNLWVKWVEIEGPLAGTTIRFPVDTLKTTGEGQVVGGGTRELTSNGDDRQFYRSERGRLCPSRPGLC